MPAQLSIRRSTPGGSEMSSHPMVDFTLSRVNQDALLAKGEQMETIRIARAGHDHESARRTRPFRWIQVRISGMARVVRRQPSRPMLIDSLDVYYPNRRR
jgi:hypothetical protein